MGSGVSSPRPQMALIFADAAVRGYASVNGSFAIASSLTMSIHAIDTPPAAGHRRVER